MADSEQMPKLDPAKDTTGLSQAHLDYIRKIEKKNRDRVQELLRVRRRNILTGTLLIGGVFGIYAYSMLAVKQETFLDDFDEPGESNVKN